VRFCSVNPAPKRPWQPSRFERVCFDGGQCNYSACSNNYRTPAPGTPTPCVARLREYYPAALEAFGDLADRDALAVLGRAPTPADAAHLSLSKIRSALEHAGRQRNIDARAQEIAAALLLEPPH
jgi:hypothetical protein